MKITSKFNKYRHELFFGLAFLITWCAWLLAACLAHASENKAITSLALILGLLGPFLAARIFMNSYFLRSTNGIDLKLKRT